MSKLPKSWLLEKSSKIVKPPVINREKGQIASIKNYKGNIATGATDTTGKNWILRTTLY